MAKKARAAQTRMSLSASIKRELEGAVERPAMREWLDRTRDVKPIQLRKKAVEAVRELREAR